MSMALNGHEIDETETEYGVQFDGPVISDDFETSDDSGIVWCEDIYEAMRVQSQSGGELVARQIFYTLPFPALSDETAAVVQQLSAGGSF